MATYTEQQLDRFMVLEVSLDELASVSDEYPDLLSEAEKEALAILQRDVFMGFAAEPLDARRDRMRKIRDALQAAYPCWHRTLEEAAGR